jgi:hypothetical protein
LKVAAKVQHDCSWAEGLAISLGRQCFVDSVHHCLNLLWRLSYWAERLHGAVFVIDGGPSVVDCLTGSEPIEVQIPLKSSVHPNLSTWAGFFNGSDKLEFPNIRRIELLTVSRSFVVTDFPHGQGSAFFKLVVGVTVLLEFFCAIINGPLPFHPQTPRYCPRSRRLYDVKFP